jgi:predicted transcriptional regulator
MEYLPENLKKIRKKWRLNQEEMGGLFDVKRDTIRRYEEGSVEVPLSVALKLEELTGILVGRLCRVQVPLQEIPTAPGKNYRNPNTDIVKDAEHETETGKSADMAAVLEEQRAMREENQKFRKDMELMAKKLSYLDEELVRLATKKKS